MQFVSLIKNIQDTNQQLQSSAAKAVNRLLTIRNWLIGYYIVEYEQNGDDRAKYGDKLLENIAHILNEDGFSFRNLKLFRQFYFLYPEIGQTVSALLQNNDIQIVAIGQTVSAQLESENSTIGQTVSDQLKIKVPPEKILNNLSFSHISLLLTIDDPLKRTFYEIEAIKGCWSVRELKRQINTLYFERSGLSADPKAMSKLVQEKSENTTTAQHIKDLYVFEFLGLAQKNLVLESDFEQALLDHLQHFILELGNGFCLEARQKRILIGDEYYFIDIVFYHRILKCHILVDLKVDEFNHANAGQLNTYLTYYKSNIMQPGDNPPAGILLVTNKNDALVQYATDGLDNKLFVSKYLIQLPSKDQLENFIKNEIKNIN